MLRSGTACDWPEHVCVFLQRGKKKNAVCDPKSLGCATSAPHRRPRTPADARRRRGRPHVAFPAPRRARHVGVDRVRVRRRAHAPGVHPREPRARGCAQPRPSLAVPRPGARHRRDGPGPVRHLRVAGRAPRARGGARRAAMRFPRARRRVVSRFPRKSRRVSRRCTGVRRRAARREATEELSRVTRRDHLRRDRHVGSRNMFHELGKGEVPGRRVFSRRRGKAERREKRAVGAVTAEPSVGGGVSRAQARRDRRPAPHGSRARESQRALVVRGAVRVRGERGAAVPAGIPAPEHRRERLADHGTSRVGGFRFPGRVSSRLRIQSRENQSDGACSARAVPSTASRYAHRR